MAGDGQGAIASLATLMSKLVSKPIARQFLGRSTLFKSHPFHL